MTSRSGISLRDKVIDFIIHEEATLSENTSSNIYETYIHDYVFAVRTHGGYSEESLKGSKINIEELIWNFITTKSMVAGYGDKYYTSRPPIVGEFHIKGDKDEPAKGVVHTLIYSNGMVQCAELINEDGDLEYELIIWLPKKMVRSNYKILLDYMSDNITLYTSS